MTNLCTSYFRTAVSMSATHLLHCDGKDINNKSASSKYILDMYIFAHISTYQYRLYLFPQVEWHVRYFWVDLVIRPHGDQK